MIFVKAYTEAQTRSTLPSMNTPRLAQYSLARVDADFARSMFPTSAQGAVEVLDTIIVIAQKTRLKDPSW